MNAERLRIARELHDIVAHAVTVMVVQAAGAGRLIDAEPSLARDAIRSVQEVGRQAMSELRRLFEVLRTVADDDGQDMHTELDRFSTLDTLIDQVRAAGVQVQVVSTGLAGRVEPSVDLAAYRIIQEALTNITRHAGTGSAAQVRISWMPDRVQIE